MGMFTELNIAVDFRKDIPERIIDILKYMLDDLHVDYGMILPKHPLFDTEKWDVMLQCGSYYFDGFTHSDLKYDKGVGRWMLIVRCNLKNYDNEIRHFLDFIEPYITTEGFIGYTRYEEDKDPTLIYHDVTKGEMIYRHPFN